MSLIASRLRDTLSRKPSGISAVIGGHTIPPEGEADDASRIAALEDAVRTLHVGITTIAGEVARIGQAIVRFGR